MQELKDNNFSSIKPTSIRRSATISIKIDNLSNGVKLTPKWYSKLESSALYSMTPDERIQMLRREIIQNTKGKGFRLDHLTTCLIEFMQEYCEANEIDVKEIKPTVLFA